MRSEPANILLEERVEDDPTHPRYASQRATAARIKRLPERILMNRARLVGLAAHRYSESDEHEALPE